jgi:hypothetical protein
MTLAQTLTALPAKVAAKPTVGDACVLAMDTLANMRLFVPHPLLRGTLVMPCSAQTGSATYQTVSDSLAAASSRAALAVPEEFVVRVLDQFWP